jgi:hypothetical protein
MNMLNRARQSDEEENRGRRSGEKLVCDLKLPFAFITYFKPVVFHDNCRGLRYTILSCRSLGLLMRAVGVDPDPNRVKTYCECASGTGIVQSNPHRESGRKAYL